MRNLKQSGKELIRLIKTMPRRIRQRLCRHVWSDIREYPGGDKGRECLKCGARNMVFYNLSGINPWAFIDQQQLRDWAYSESITLDGVTYRMWCH